MIDTRRPKPLTPARLEWLRIKREVGEEERRRRAAARAAWEQATRGR